MTILSIRSERVLERRGRLRAATVHVKDGRIVGIGGYDERPAGVQMMDVGDLMVLPGLVDTHVHINEPGRTEWEGFESATRAAAAGGITTIVDMPLNCIPATTTVEALEEKLRAGTGKCHVDVGFWGGLVPGNAAHLEPLARAGVFGYKCFLSPSGVDEFPHVSEADLREALPLLADLQLPLLVHAELPALLRAPDPMGDPRAYRTWMDSRPLDAERAAVELLLRITADAEVHVHVVHLSSPDGASDLTGARTRRGLMTTETCPHYLTFAAEDIPDGATAFKCAPPIRGRAHRDRLWQSLAQHRIDLVVSDHSPAPASLKRLEDGNVVEAWGGIASLQLTLAAVWTGAAAHGLQIGEVVRWMSEAPAQLLDLETRKGCIAPGRDADLVLWDPDAEIVVHPPSLEHRHPVTPYAGTRLRGQVRTTLLRGEIVYDEGTFPSDPRGRYLFGCGRKMQA